MIKFSRISMELPRGLYRDSDADLESLNHLISDDIFTNVSLGFYGNFDAGFELLDILIFCYFYGDFTEILMLILSH